MVVVTDLFSAGGVFVVWFLHWDFVKPVIDVRDCLAERAVAFGSHCIEVHVDSWVAFDECFEVLEHRDEFLGVLSCVVDLAA